MRPDWNTARPPVTTRSTSAPSTTAQPTPATRPAIPDAELRGWNAVQPATIRPATVRTPTTTQANAAAASVRAATTTQSSAVAAIAPTRVPPDARTLALLSQDVYRDTATPPAGWRVAGTADLDRVGVDAATLEYQQTGFRARIYVEGTGADTRYVLSFRGSTTRGDWIANGEQAVGMSTDHYRRALLLGDQLGRATGIDVTMTGHSLGGGLASAASVASGRTGVTFNASGLSSATIASADALRQASGAAAPQVSAYYVRGEVLSALQDGGDRVAAGLLGWWLGGPGGGTVAAALVDAPSAYGQRIALDAVRPEGKHWWNDQAIDRHGMDWVLAGLDHR